MKINHSNLICYMNAIRKSKDPLRTLESFWDTQIESKLWLIKNLKKHIHGPILVEIHGGWTGVLASFLFQSKLDIKKIYNIDIDPSCKLIAEEINMQEFYDNKFEHVVRDMVEYSSTSDVVINCSCEHISGDVYNKWLCKLNTNQLIVLQSNNFDIPEHIRLAKNLSDFKRQSNLSRVVFSGTLRLPMYNRFMLIGYK